MVCFVNKTVLKKGNIFARLKFAIGSRVSNVYCCMTYLNNASVSQTCQSVSSQAETCLRKFSNAKREGTSASSAHNATRR